MEDAIQCPYARLGKEGAKYGKNDDASNPRRTELRPLQNQDQTLKTLGGFTWTTHPSKPQIQQRVWTNQTL